ncbi:YutD family protein [Lapidilactobacillus luobeiensis]|uniref:YutD family protein n=1 Tax=Lapidilactobacillus luobeiensis TaxID=2950371 RepID=UPI0021C42125|nr:YutD family protein [Lapidilactobacillus luobeiensis]
MSTDELDLASLTSQPQIFNMKHDQDPDYQGTVVKVLDPDHLEIGTRAYRLVTNYHHGFEPERLGERFEPILSKYDYIVGDWGFDQLRLRGFYVDENRNANRDQVISSLEDYLIEFCNFGCAFFVLEKSGPNSATSNRTPSRRPRNRSGQESNRGNGRRGNNNAASTSANERNRHGERRRGNHDQKPRTEPTTTTGERAQRTNSRANRPNKGKQTKNSVVAKPEKAERSQRNPGRIRRQADTTAKSSPAATPSVPVRATAAQTTEPNGKKRFHIRALDQK